MMNNPDNIGGDWKMIKIDETKNKKNKVSNMN